jgi:hypothetical protein
MSNIYLKFGCIYTLNNVIYPNLDKFATFFLRRREYKSKHFVDADSSPFLSLVLKYTELE